MRMCLAFFVLSSRASRPAGCSWPKRRQSGDGTCHAAPPKVDEKGAARWPAVVEPNFCAEHHAAPSTKTQRLIEITALT